MFHPNLLKLSARHNNRHVLQAKVAVLDKHKRRRTPFETELNLRQVDLNFLTFVLFKSDK
jgi:hypothetical protein